MKKDIVLNTSLKFKAWMDLDTQDTAGGGSWTVIMTRSTDVYVTLSGRCTYANNNSATRFMSIHNNAYNNTANGIETFCWGSGSSNSFDLRNKVYEGSHRHVASRSARNQDRQLHRSDGNQYAG